MILLPDNQAVISINTVATKISGPRHEAALHARSRLEKMYSNRKAFRQGGRKKLGRTTTQAAKMRCPQGGCKVLRCY